MVKKRRRRKAKINAIRCDLCGYEGQTYSTDSLLCKRCGYLTRKGS